MESYKKAFHSKINQTLKHNGANNHFWTFSFDPDNWEAFL